MSSYNKNNNLLFSLNSWCAKNGKREKLNAFDLFFKITINHTPKNHGDMHKLFM